MTLQYPSNHPWWHNNTHQARLDDATIPTNPGLGWNPRWTCNLKTRRWDLLTWQPVPIKNKLQQALQAKARTDTVLAIQYKNFFFLFGFPIKTHLLNGTWRMGMTLTQWFSLRVSSNTLESCISTEASMTAPDHMCGQQVLHKHLPDACLTTKDCRSSTGPCSVMTGTTQTSSVARCPGQFRKNSEPNERKVDQISL